jgi:hypothetical protein
LRRVGEGRGLLGWGFGDCGRNFGELWEMLKGIGIWDLGEGMDERGSGGVWVQVIFRVLFGNIYRRIRLSIYRKALFAFSRLFR